MSDTPIQWVVNPDGTLGKTWNPIRGCELASPGCTNCYAMRTAFRFNGEGMAYAGLTRARKSLGPVWTGEVRPQPDMLALPLTWAKPTTVFVASMADPFHPDVPDEFIAAIFGIIAATPHTYQLLTKRSERMLAWHRAYPTAWWGGSVAKLIEVAANLAIGLTKAQRARLDAAMANPPTYPLARLINGVSVENQHYADQRIPHLLQTPGRRMLSLEPLLGPVDLWALRDGSWHDAEGADYYDCLRGSSWWANGDHGLGGGPKIDQVIVGGESGPRAREFDLEWARRIGEKCAEAGVAYFFKQAGKVVVDSSRSEVLNAKGGVAYVRDASDPDGMLAAARDLGREVRPLRLRLKDSHGGDLDELPAELRVRQSLPPVAAEGAS